MADATTFPAPATPADELDRFVFLLQTAIERGSVRKLVLARPRAPSAGPQRVSVRPLLLGGEAHLSFVDHHATRDVTRNLGIDDGVQAVRDALCADFGHAHLFTTAEEIQLLVSQRGRQTLRRKSIPGGEVPAERAAGTAAAATAHDRPKRRVVDIDRPFLVELGVTDAQHRLVPAMARKWKQINKFIEVVDAALDASSCGDAAGLRVVDYGAGKGYLTFALHEHLRRDRGIAAQTIGVELRDDLVRSGNAAAQRLGLDGLAFEQGDVRSHVPARLDVMIALHACDTATDHAIHTGVRAGAEVIMCSPCCHKQLRPQMQTPSLLRPMLRHGVHLGQQADMLTDTLRALLLDASGYDTQVFEFVALEHTAKNKMILAVKRAPGSKPAGAEGGAWQRVEALKNFYGVREQCLETLLRADAAA